MDVNKPIKKLPVQQMLGGIPLDALSAVGSACYYQSVNEIPDEYLYKNMTVKDLSTGKTLRLTDLAAKTWQQGDEFTDTEKTKLAAIEENATNIANHSVTDTNDVTSVGSGKIVTDDERLNYFDSSKRYFEDTDPSTVTSPPTGVTYIGSFGGSLWSMESNGVVQNYGSADHYRGSINTSSAVPTNLQNGDWVRCIDANGTTYTNFDNLTADQYDKLEYSEESDSWSVTNDGSTGDITATSDIDFNSHKGKNLADGEDDADAVNLKQLKPLEKPVYYNGSTSKSLINLINGDKGSYEFIFSINDISGNVQPIAGSASYGTPWFSLNSNGKFYAKFGTTYINPVLDELVVKNKKYHCQIMWDTGAVLIYLDGNKVIDTTYSGNCSIIKFGIGNNSTLYFNGTIYLMIVKNSTGAIIYNGNGKNNPTSIDLNYQLTDFIKELRTESFEYVTIIRNSDGVVSSADILFESGSKGHITFSDYNQEFIVFDSYSITHNVSGLTLTQPKMTRDINGNIITKPLVTIN